MVLDNSLFNKISSIKDPKLSEFGFHIIGGDGTNPWSARSYGLSPNDVLELTSRGVEIIATPHIGLHWPSNTMYPHMGVVIHDVMSNQSIRDNADEPENILEGGSRHNCAIQKVATLSPYLQLDSQMLGQNGYIAAKQFLDCKNLAHVHHTAKKKALGEEFVKLDADLLDAPFVYDFFQTIVLNQQYILGEHSTHSGIFNRFCSSIGEVTHCEPGGVEVVEGYLLMKRIQKDMIINDKIFSPSGYLPINEILVMLDAVTCWWKQIQNGINSDAGIGDAYLVSGIDMIHYLKGKHLREMMNRMYEVLVGSEKFSWLPKHLRVTIIPGGSFKFLPCIAEEELTHTVLELLRLNDELIESKHAIRQAKEQKLKGEEFKKLIEANQTINRVINPLQEKLNILLAQRRGFSQYDILNGDHVDERIITKLMGMDFEHITKLFPVT